MKMVTVEDFKKFDIRIGKVVAAEKVKEADKLINGALEARACNC